MEQKNINYLILAFVFLIVGVALIGAIAVNVNDRVDKLNIANESIDIGPGLTEGNEVNTAGVISITNLPTGWKSADCPITNFVIRNETGATATVTTDYVFTASAGTFTLLNTTTWVTSAANNSYADYTYCADSYLNSSWGRSVLGTVPGFFALALLGVSIWLFWRVFESVGIGKQR